VTAPPNTIGVDLGGTWLRVARVSPEGRVEAMERLPTDGTGGPAGVVAQIEAMTGRLSDAGTRAMGVGVPGSFDGDSGTVLGIPALPGWAGFPLAVTLRERTGLDCTLENDAKAAAMGEWDAGAAKGFRNFVYVTVSTGIGACAVVDGRMLRGAGGLAGEIGHTRIAETSERCVCGLYGCWQALAAGPALARRAEAAARSAPGSALAALGALGPLSGLEVGRAARAGDATALAVVREHASLLAIGFANLQHVYAPDLLVVGGGVSDLLDLMRAPLEMVLRERLLPGFRPAEIRVAALGDAAGLVGAASVARSQPDPKERDGRPG
jgi:glucokinase